MRRWANLILAIYLLAGCYMPAINSCLECPPGSHECDWYESGGML